MTVVPARIRTADDLAARFGRDEAERIGATTGIHSVHLVSPGQTAQDLAQHAATRLLAALNLSPRDVQGIVMVTQSADYSLPASACILQDRLGLPKSVLAFDVNLGCSAFPYGLAIVRGLLAAGPARRILLLVADTPSLHVHPEDRSAVPLFGDAAAATLLEADPDAEDLLGVDLGTDGGGWANLIMPVGKYRYPTRSDFAASRPPCLAKVEYPEHTYINGAEIFTFTLREVPGLVERTLAAAKVSAEAVDYYFFHQANKFILDYLIRKMRLPAAKCPLSIGSYGNTSGVSPAVTACHAAAAVNRERELLAAFVAFGVGYSWGGAMVRLRPGVLFPIEELA